MRVEHTELAFLIGPHNDLNVTTHMINSAINKAVLSTTKSIRNKFSSAKSAGIIIIKFFRIHRTKFIAWLLLVVL